MRSKHRRDFRTGEQRESIALRPPRLRKKGGRPVQRDNYTPALRGLVQNGLIHNPYPIPEKLPAAVSDDIHRDPSRLVFAEHGLKYGSWRLYLRDDP
jgi:hypothetical protein